MFLLHSSGLNSILFAINIDNSDLNGGATRAGGPLVSHLLKESTQGIGSLWKESTQGVSSLLREISTATAVVPGFTPRVEGASDPLPVLPRSTSAGETQLALISRRVLQHNEPLFDKCFNLRMHNECTGETSAVSFTMIYSPIKWGKKKKLPDCGPPCQLHLSCLPQSIPSGAS